MIILLITNYYIYIYVIYFTYSGHLLGVTATCALELGVDVGSLDCTLHLGYPGSASSLRQQAGRAGRSGQDSTSILICFDSAIDQFYASHPRILCDIPSESVILSENTHVLRAHLLAAARELPLNLSWNLPSKQHDASPTMTSNVPVTDSLDCFVSEEGLMSSDIDPVELGRRIWEQNQKKLYITSSHTTISSATISDRSSSNSTNGDNDSHGLVSDSELWGNLYTEVVTYLCNAGNLQARPTCHQSHQKSVISHTNILENNSFHPTGSTNETSFSLRLIDPVSISIVDISQSVEREIDSLGYSRAFFELFEGAIYMHRAEQYRIVKLDLRIHKASCIPVRVDYYTASCNSTNIVITKVHREQSLVKSGHCTVSTDVYGYYKIRLRTGEKFDKGECSLPPLVFDTQATWIDLPLPIKAALESENINPEAAIHSLSHVLLTLAHILTQCDVSDLETEHIALFGTVSNKTQSLRILFYDKRPGGLGLANHLFTHLPKMLESARELLEECPCSGGCPSCILSSTCGGYNQCINKNGALILATLLCSAIADPVYKSDQDTINNVSTVPGPTASIPFHLMSPNTKIKTRKLFSSSRADYMDFGELQQLKVQNPWSESCGYFYSDYDLLQR